jgi:HAMP domain-containing protein
MNVQPQKTRRRGWPLRRRLTVLIATTVLAGTIAGAALDYRRERAAHVDATLDTLWQEAEALKLARAHFANDAEFAKYADELCRQVKEASSPGHHILVLDRSEAVAVDATHHSGADVTRALRAAEETRDLLTVDGRRFAHARTRDAKGNTYIVAQSMEPVEQILQNEVANRVLTAAAVSAALIGLIYLAMSRWVLQPLGNLAHAAKAWSRREFSRRATPGGPPDVEMLADELNAMAAQLERVRATEDAELDRARQIQRNLMPAVIPAIPGLSLVALFRPAETVAGDLYDVVDLPRARRAIFILDVSGHGISAALLTGVVKMSLHRRLVEFDDPADAIRATNDDLLQCLTTGSFVTACVGIYNPADRTWTYCAAGHPGGVLVRKGAARVLSATGALLGVIREGEWTSSVVRLEEGDRVLLFTDGITDAGRPEQTAGLDGIFDALRGASGDPLEAVMRRIADRALLRCGDTVCDDMTMVGFEVLPGGQGGQYYVI